MSESTDILQRWAAAIARWPQRFKHWFLNDAPSWAVSALAHALLLMVAALILGDVVVEPLDNGTTIEAVAAVANPATEELQRFEVGDPPLDPSELTTETLMMTEALPIAQTEQINDDSPDFEAAGGGTAAGTEAGAGLGFDVAATGLGPTVRGGGGVDTGLGEGTRGGRGGAGSGFGSRGSGMRQAASGVTKASERAVAAALNWIARHQNPDGSWSMDHAIQTRCTDRSCTGAGSSASNPAATALALLPFLAAGQTHETKGPYQRHIMGGIQWLIKNQQQNGDLSDLKHQMYAHGLAAIALCEAYGMTNDSRVGHPAQAAIRFIESGQNPQGSWRYAHGDGGSDTSVFGWQVMALKSAQMAGLQVDHARMELCKTWLKLAGSGYHGGKFSYTADGNPTPSMTAVGLLTTQYLGADRDDPIVREAIQFIMERLPNPQDRDIYYWYYATQAMHNVPGKDWDKWNRRMRRLLIETQEKTDCASGSWNPGGDASDPNGDTWGTSGGRLMVTCLSALTLEVYYRYLPLYQLDRDDSLKALEKPPAEKDEDEGDKN